MNALNYKHQIICLCLCPMNVHYSLILFCKGKEKSWILISDSCTQVISGDTGSAQETGVGVKKLQRIAKAVCCYFCRAALQHAIAHTISHTRHVRTSCIFHLVHKPSCLTREIRGWHQHPVYKQVSKDSHRAQLHPYSEKKSYQWKLNCTQFFSFKNIQLMYCFILISTYVNINKNITME